MSRFRSLVITLMTLASATLLAAATPSSAEAQTGRIAGIVTDSTRAALAGTQVTVVGTRYSAVTDPSGRFSITGIPAGTYEVRVQRLGQRAQVVSGVVVTARLGVLVLGSGQSKTSNSGLRPERTHVR